MVEGLISTWGSTVFSFTCFGYDVYVLNIRFVSAFSTLCAILLLLLRFHNSRIQKNPVLWKACVRRQLQPGDQVEAPKRIYK